MVNNLYLTNTPLISVIIPAYNAERFIERTLQSVLNQTYQNLEVIVVDDGSHDRTAEIVTTIAQQDSRVKLLHQSNSGVASARNLAIQAAQGEFIAPIDADDLWHSTQLEKQLHCMIQSGSTTGFVYSWSLEIDEVDRLSGGFHVSTHHGNVYLRLLHHNFLGHASATLIRRACLETVGGYNCGLRTVDAQGCEDWDLYLRLAKQYQVNVVPEFLVGYRRSPFSMSRCSEAMAKSHQYVLEAALKNHPQIPPQIYRWSMSNFYIYLAHQNCQVKQYDASWRWLYQALQLDWTMVLLRPDLYLLLVDYLLARIHQIIKSSHLRFRYNRKLAPTREIQLSEIEIKAKIRKLLPSKRYEQMRLKLLALKPNSEIAPIPLVEVPIATNLSANKSSLKDG